MKTYVLTGESHICFDDEEKTILTVTNSSFINNSAIAYTKDPRAFYGLFDNISAALSGSQNLNGAPAFIVDTEENFNNVKALVLEKFSNL
jgi:hypothetical protein